MGGAVIGVVGQFISDLISSIGSEDGKIHFSSWETYVGAAVGGAVGAVVSLTPLSGAASAISGGVTTFVGMGLEMLTGKREKNLTNLIINVAFDSIMGHITGKLTSKLVNQFNFAPTLLDGTPGLGQNASRFLGKNATFSFVSTFRDSIAMDIYYGIKQMQPFKTFFDNLKGAF